MIILAIETSCDDTSVALVRNGCEVLAMRTHSQVKSHRKYGGVVPELASRLHVERIHGLLDAVFRDAGLNLAQIDAIAVTVAPGLEGSLIIGVTVAKTIGVLTGKPVIPVHHIYGHIYSVMLAETPPEFPFVSLVASGGHTQLWLAKGHYDFELLGQTRDDAAGEAFDKVARLLGLGYPGGPEIEKLAESGNPKRFHFPRAMRQSRYEFSFSGIKTAVSQLIQGLESPFDSPLKADIAASFQAAVVDMLVDKAANACRNFDSKTLCIVGGVSANR
ncbi:tRNA (adenosine(37)-N6)-threonylcarbamoyltransferase complex transferase subunit TsaD, partial [bacterium]|nr:tRNA (adenosine(37)-N6)-threonylcarbamoyltransferase complex transferase subunit TsaD [bacterium]